MAVTLCTFLAGNAQDRLSLEQSKLLALQNNPKVKNSELELAAAREIKKDAYASYFPKIGASAVGMQAVDPLLQMNMKGGNLPVYDGNPANLPGATQFAYMPDISIGLFDQVALGYLNVLQPVYAGGKIRTGNQLAELNIAVRERQRKLSENEVLLKTEQEYWQVIAVQEKQQTLNTYIRFLDTLYAQVNNAFKNGLIIKNDLLKVRIKQQELQVNRIKLENARKLVTMQLCETIGLPYQPAIVLDERLDNFSSPAVHFMSSQAALPDRMEYKLLEKAVAASQLETKMKKGDYLPSLGVGVTGYYLNQFNTGQKGIFNGMVYASLSIPVSDWWTGKHKINELQYREKIALNTFEGTKGLLNLQMEKAWTDLSEADDKIHLIRETLVQAAENLKVNQDSYNNGLIQLADLLEARALKAGIEDQLIEAKAQYKIAVTNYLQVTGR